MAQRAVALWSALAGALAAGWVLCAASRSPPLHSASHSATHKGTHNGFQDVPCSEREHECLSLGRLLNPRDGRCYVVDGLFLCEDVNLFFAANKTVALSGGGLHGQCVRKPCMYSDVFAAATGRCESSDDFKEVCGGVEQLHRLRNVFGEEVCAPAGGGAGPPPPPPSPPQMPYSGRCRVPPWTVPARGPKYVNRLQYASAPCSPQEFSCYQQEQVLYNGSCWALRERGPCDERQWLVLDEAQVTLHDSGYASTNSTRIEAVCKERPCGSGLVLPAPGSAAGSACARPSDIRRRYCGSDVLAMDVFGLAGCGFTLLKELPTTAANGSCGFSHSGWGYAAISGVGGEGCARDDKGQCTTRVEEAKARFILYPEDD